MMKNLAFVFGTAILMSGCDHSHSTTAEAGTKDTVAVDFFGAEFDTTAAITVAALEAAMQGKDSLETKFNCTISATCKKAGCWMDVNLPSGETMTVFMKDHAFGVPLEGAEGLPAIVNGVAYFDTLSVDYLRHLAEDAGKSAEEIALINEPKPVLAVDASGVMIRGFKAPEGAAEGEGHDHEHDHDHDHEGENHEGHSH